MASSLGAFAKNEGIRYRIPVLAMALAVNFQSPMDHGVLNSTEPALKSLKKEESQTQLRTQRTTRHSSRNRTLRCALATRDYRDCASMPTDK